jgi:hypothetical protein
MAHGPGTKKDTDGKVYSGNWLFGKPNGFGTVTTGSGRIYRGHWVNGVK